MSQVEQKPVRIGIAGLGVAGGAVLPAILKHPRFELAAIAEPGDGAREAGVSATGAPGFKDLMSMLAGSELDAVYIATPTTMHVEHISQAFAAGKHVLTEKPVAATLDDAKAIVAAGSKAGRVLVVGHAHGFDLPIKRMREIIESGKIGRVRMIQTWNYTDWLFRPRVPDELDTSKGGGVTYRQGSHQFDIARVLGGGRVKSVRAATFNWDSRRDATGAHTVFLEFEDGCVATAVYNGYGYLSTIELCDDVTEWGFIEKIEQRKPVVRSTDGRSPEQEMENKRKRAASVTSVTSDAPFQPYFGLTVVSCERGDMRQSQRGLYVYSEAGREEIILPTDLSPHHLMLDEFHDTITGTAKPVHSGEWGLANLEVSVAAIESARTGKEVALKYQVGMP